MHGLDTIEIQKALVNCKSKKLRFHVLQLLKMINLVPNSLSVHQKVDDFYYRQKHQELEVLEEQLHKSAKETMKYLNLLEATYSDIYEHWKIDIKILKQNVGKTQPKHLTKTKVDL